MDISRLRRPLKGNLAQNVGLIGMMFVFLCATLGVLSRVLDRNENGKWELWRKAYLPDGYHYMLEAIRVSPFKSNLGLSEKYQNIFFPASGKLNPPSIEVVHAVQARPLYPYLTSLFINLDFEIAPLIFPILSWVVLITFIYRNIERNLGRPYALIVISIFSSSFYMRLDFIGTTTDAIAALLCYLAFSQISYLESRAGTRFIFGVTILAGVFTRPVDPIFLALLVGLVVIKWKNTSLRNYVLFLAVLVISHLAYIQLVYKQLNVGSINTAGSVSSTLLEHLIGSAIKVPKIVTIELGFLLIHDFIFMLLIFWCFLAVMLSAKKDIKLLYFLIFTSTFYLASLNGTVGSGFRYELPIAMFSLSALTVCDSPKSILVKIETLYFYRILKKD